MSRVGRGGETGAVFRELLRRDSSLPARRKWQKELGQKVFIERMAFICLFRCHASGADHVTPALALLTHE